MYNTKILDLLFVFLFNFYYTLKIITCRNFEFILTNIICIEQTFKKRLLIHDLRILKLGCLVAAFKYVINI